MRRKVGLSRKPYRKYGYKSRKVSPKMKIRGLLSRIRGVIRASKNKYRPRRYSRYTKYRSRVGYKRRRRY